VRFVNVEAYRRLIFPTGDPNLVFLKNVIDDPEIEVGEYTYYHDYFRDPRDFLKNNILYHFPNAGDHVVIGKFCSIATGVKILCPLCHHAKSSLAYYPFPLFPELSGLHLETDLDWAHRGEETVIGNDVWLGFESVIMPGVHIGDGAAVGTRSVVTHDVEPYTVVVGSPAKAIRKRFDDATIDKLLDLKWWNLPEWELQLLLPDIVHSNIAAVLEKKKLIDATRHAVETLWQA